MKKLIISIMILVTLITLSSCIKYTSSFKAIGLVRSNNSHSCSASFHSLEGQLVFKIKKSDLGASEGDISYSIVVEQGEVKLSYDIYGVKEDLAFVKSGESVDSRGGYVETGKYVYIIIEGTNNARGKVTVELDN